MPAVTLPKLNKGQRFAAARALDTADEFASYYLQVDLWDTQRRILQAINNPHSRVAVKACHSSSKTFTAACAALHLLSAWDDVVVVTTAPTWPQVEKLLWGEIHSALKRSRYPFPSALATELYMGPRRYIVGRSTSVTKQDEGVKFQGIHAEHVLVIIDEAPGVNPKIWDAIDGISAGGDVRILALGNPTISSGKFYDVFNTDARATWGLFTISAFETPNLAGLTVADLLAMPEAELGNDARPYLVTRRWVLEKYHELGEDNPFYQSRVLGQFPLMDEFSLISSAWLEAAKVRELEVVGECTAGLDVAGPGEDETVLVVRKGPVILEVQAWPEHDPRGKVIAALRQYDAQLTNINVDSAGIGYYMARHIEDNGFRNRVTDVNVGESATSEANKEKYANLKAELYWGLRMRIQAGDFAGLTDERTIGQLAGIRWESNPRGQTKIESKEDARKRGVKSPDRAEAVMLAFAKVRGCGLFDLWREQAEAAKRPQNKNPYNPDRPVNAAELAAAQKTGTWMESVKTLGKVATTKQPPQSSACPKCGNKFPQEFVDAYHCHCGHDWQKEKKQ